MENELEQTIEQTVDTVAEETKAEVNAPVAEKVAPSVVAKSDAPKAARSNKRVLVGKVTSNKADKTIVVAVVRQVAHPLYKKYFKRTKKFMAHDELNSCKVGDTVKVVESRPLSARKRWTLVEIIERAK